MQPSVENMDMTFSYKNVNSSVTDDYEHDMLVIPPSQMELDKAEEAR